VIDPKDLRHNARRGAENDRGGIDDPSATAAIVGAGYWRENGDTPAAFLRECAAIYERRTGRPPALAICAPAMVGELAGCGVVLRSAKINARLVILAG